jgi:hypothetical protein
MDKYSQTIMNKNYKIFVPWMSGRTNQQYVLDAFNRLNIGTIEQVSMHKKYKNGPYYTCMLEFSNPTTKGYNALFQFLDNPLARIQIKHKFGYWQVKKFNEKPKETIEVAFSNKCEAAFSNKCLSFEETYPDYFNHDALITPRPIFLEKPASPELVLPPPPLLPIFKLDEPHFIFPLDSPELYRPVTPNLFWDEFPLYHSSKKYD